MSRGNMSITYPKDNLYRRLGTRSDISQERIREKYVTKIREFPPEFFPEEFRKIREAYAILIDPKTRAEYDAARKNKDSFEELFAKAKRALFYADYDKGQQFLERALELRQTLDAYMTLAHSHILKNEDLEKFEYYCALGINLADNDHERCMAEVSRADVLFEVGRFEQGLELAYQIVEKYSKEKELCYGLLPNLIEVAYEEDCPDVALEFIERLLPEKGSEGAEDLILFESFVDAMDTANRWDRKSFIASRLKSLARNIQDETEREQAITKSETLFDLYYEAGRFREAELFLSFLRELDRKDQDYKKWALDIKEKVAFENSYRRLTNDPTIFPGVTVRVSTLYMEQLACGRDVFDDEGAEPSMEELMEMLDLSELEYKFCMASGLKLLKKKYPLIHGAFKEDLEILLKESVVGMNRQDRRALR